MSPGTHGKINFLVPTSLLPFTHSSGKTKCQLNLVSNNWACWLLAVNKGLNVSKSIVLDNRSCKASEKQKVMTTMSPSCNFCTLLWSRSQTDKKYSEKLQVTTAQSDTTLQSTKNQEWAKQRQMLAEQDTFRVKMTMIYLWEKLLPAAAVSPACPDSIFFFLYSLVADRHKDKAGLCKAAALLQVCARSCVCVCVLYMSCGSFENRLAQPSLDPPPQHSQRRGGATFSRWSISLREGESEGGRECERSRERGREWERGTGVAARRPSLSDSEFIGSQADYFLGWDAALMTGLGAGDAGPTGDLQVQVDEPESDSLPSQVGNPHQLPYLFCRQQIIRQILKVLKNHSLLIKLKFAPKGIIWNYTNSEQGGRRE